MNATGLGEDFTWFHPAEGLSRAAVELSGHRYLVNLTVLDLNGTDLSGSIHESLLQITGLLRQYILGSVRLRSGG